MMKNMSNELYTLEQIKTSLYPVFKKYNVRRAILFGSYAKGTATFNSDIDILVGSSLKGLSFFGLLEDIVTTLNKNADLLDITQIIPNSRIETEIQKTEIVIYEQ